MVRLEDPIEIGGLDVPNRLYRAPLLECAGTGPGTADRLVRELEPAAASGVGLVCQGATIVRGEGGCAAPGMTRVDDPAFVADLAAVPAAIHDHDGRIVIQLEHGGLRSLETWHAAYRERHPDLRQLAVSNPPKLLRAAERAGFLSFDVHVLSTEEVYELARDFGRCAGYAVDAGYDGIHVAGANMGIVHQFLSPYYNRREDEFADGVRFLECVYEAIREEAGDVALMTKVPAETERPPFVRRHLTLDDGVSIARRLESIGFDALVPVTSSPFWDMHLIRGAYPERAWRASDLQRGYEEAFGSRWRAKTVAAANRLQAAFVDDEPAWNREFCDRVRESVSVPVLCEGGIRTRGEIDRLLGDAATPRSTAGSDPDRERPCDMVGLGRPFYAEPRLGARLLRTEPVHGTQGETERNETERHEAERRERERPTGDGIPVDGDRDGSVRALCRNCNNCTVPQVTGARGRCRTPSVVRERARLENAGVYDDRNDEARRPDD